MNFMSINLITKMKWTNFFERETLSKQCLKKYAILIVPHLLKKFGLTLKLSNNKKIQTGTASLSNSSKYLRNNANSIHNFPENR